MKTKSLSFLVAVSALLAGLVILVSHPDLTWHDQQRLGLIALSALAFAGISLLRTPSIVSINPVWLSPTVGVLALGGLSAALAQHPLWAAAEYALLVASIGISAFVFLLMRSFGDRADLILGGFLRLLLASMVFQFYVSFASALAHGDLYFVPVSLIYGFSNERFEGQFLTLVVPLLGAALCMPLGGSLRYPRGLDLFLMVSLAAMVFVVGTRGTVAAWLSVCILFWGFKGGGRDSAKRMLVVLAAGFILAWLILHTVSWVTGQVVDYRFAGEQVFGLSLREILWKHAWATIVDHPWLGVGPMHFASLGDRVAAHPHQALLQIGSEWGLPVLFMILAVVAVWLIKVFAELRSGDAKPGADLRWALLFAVLSSMLQSMVDGVLVMPYPQLWLAITVGWCSARCLPRFQGVGVKVPVWIPLLLWAGANVVLVSVAVMSYPDLVGAPEYCGGGPRFWCNGRI
jgi:O-antigen ligase